jgi:hypothetical protein
MHRKRNSTNLNVKQKLGLGASVANVCEEHGHLDLTDIRQYRTPPSPQISPLNRGYAVFFSVYVTEYFTSPTTAAK